QHLREIAETKLANLQKTISKSTNGFNKVNIKWSENVVRWLQEYHYVAEEQARPIDNKIKSLIEDTLVELANRDLIQPNDALVLTFHVVKEFDNTFKMVFQVKNLEKTKKADQVFDLPVSATEVERARAPISDEQLDNLMKLPENMKESIVGQR